jgi:serine/threonine protein kinase
MQRVNAKLAAERSSGKLAADENATDFSTAERSTVIAATQLDAEDRISAIWGDMRHRWSQGNPLPAEDYLHNEFPNGCSAEVAIDIIYAEFVLSEEHGKYPRIADFLLRFPQYAEPLRKQLELHSTLGAEPLDHQFDQSAQVRPLGMNADASIYPRQFGRLTLIALLESGGQAEVYRAVHPDLAQEVVVKIERHDAGMHGAVGHDRLLSEARLLASLSHPNLIRILDAGVVEGRAFLVLEYIRGRTLTQYARECRPTAREAALLVAKIARAVSAIHSVGIIHLDIKPQNILIDERGEPRLLDFGLSRWDNSWTFLDNMELGIAGTLAYMSPEQASFATHLVGPHTDLFSLGAVMYLLLTDQPLYRQQPLTEMLDSVRAGRWDSKLLSKSGASRRLMKVCSQALELDIDRRFSSADQFISALQSTRSKLFEWGVVVIVALLLAIAGTYLWSTQTNPKSPIVVPIVKPIDLKLNVFQRDKWLGLESAVPLRNGDELRIEATIPANHRAGLFIVTSEDTVRQIAELPANETEQGLSFPSGETAIPLIGMAGTECLFVVCSTANLPSADELAECLKSEPEWPQLSDYTIIRATSQAVSTEQSSKGLGNPRRRPDPESRIKQRLESLRQFMNQKKLFFEALAFSHSR